MNIHTYIHTYIFINVHPTIVKSSRSHNRESRSIDLSALVQMNAQERLLREVSNSTDDDLKALLEQTSAMDQSVLALKNKLEQQRLSVKQLVHAAKSSGKAAEGALHDARRSKGMYSSVCMYVCMYVCFNIDMCSTLRPFI
jgi:hypothetical protein